MTGRFIGTAFLALAATLAISSGAAADDDWKAPPEAKAKANPVADDEAAVTAGKAIYEARCANCHGFGGKGDGKASRSLKEKPSDLTAEDEAMATDGELFWKITTGHMPMPSFEKRLPEEQRWQVVRYLRRLQALGGVSAAEPAAAPQSSPPAAPGH